MDEKVGRVMPEVATTERQRGIDRVIDLLEELLRLRTPTKVGELARRIGAPRSTLYAIVNRLVEISVRVRQVCDKYDLPYTTGSLLVQYGKAWRTIAKLSLPNKYLSDPADDAPENRSEKMFAELEPAFVGTDPATGAG